MASIFHRLKKRPAHSTLHQRPILPKPEIIRRGHVDNAILNHEKLFTNLLTLEKFYQPNQSIIFDSIQTDVKPWMRKMVVTWLLEVCEEIQTELEVFFIAVNIMDRMLEKLFFKRDHFQLLGAASMLIASKLKETLPITADKMVVYTDNSILFDDLIHMEQLILAELVWDVSCPTVVDFIDILCHRSAKTFGGDDERTLNRVKSAALFISQQTQIEHQFIGILPSITAAACVAIAANDILSQKAASSNSASSSNSNSPVKINNPSIFSQCYTSDYFSSSSNSTIPDTNAELLPQLPMKAIVKLPQVTPPNPPPRTSSFSSTKSSDIAALWTNDDLNLSKSSSTSTSSLTSSIFDRPTHSTQTTVIHSTVTTPVVHSLQSLILDLQLATGNELIGIEKTINLVSESKIFIVPEHLEVPQQSSGPAPRSSTLEIPINSLFNKNNSQVPSQVVVTSPPPPLTQPFGSNNINSMNNSENMMNDDEFNVTKTINTELSELTGTLFPSMTDENNPTNNASFESIESILQSLFPDHSNQQNGMVL